MMENALHRGKNQPESERPAKRLARQLDFTGFSASSTSLILPEHPLIATATSPRPHQKRMQSQAPYPFNRSIKLESSRGRRRSNAEAKDVNPKKQKHCNCKHSKCLKLYCECFASGVYCDGCNCVNCHNDVDMEDARREAIESTLERNPSAFKPKIASSPRGAKASTEDATEDVIIGRHNKGCHCKKSGCLKKYCECFQANILCSENCKCMDCKNSEGNERRRAIFHGENANNLMYPQQGANDVITGAISSSRYDSSPLPKRRKGQEPLYGTNKMSIRTLQELQQAKKMRSSLHSPSLSSVAFARNENVVALTSSKLTYRSLLAGIVQPEDLKELCSVLVVHSKDTARELSDEKTDKPESYQTFPKQEDSFQSGTEDNQTQCPVSPGTLALLCDEHDTNVVPNPPKLPYLEGISEIYAKQERIVLTKFLCCLSKIVTLGEIRETKCSSGSRTESGSLQNLIMAQGLNES